MSDIWYFVVGAIVGFVACVLFLLAWGEAFLQERGSDSSEETPTVLQMSGSDSLSSPPF